MNLLSEGIVTASAAAPGPNVERRPSSRPQATRRATRSTPTRTGAYATLPQPNTTYVSSSCDGQNGNQPDTRFPGRLRKRSVPDHKVRPVLRRATPSTRAHASTTAPTSATRSTASTRCTRRPPTEDGHDLWTWVHETAGDSNGASPPPSPFGPQSTEPGCPRHGLLQHGGGRRSGAELPRSALRDVGDELPPGGDGRDRRQPCRAGHRLRRLIPGRERLQGSTPPVGEIENPNPLSGTNNWYTEDGYGCERHPRKRRQLLELLGPLRLPGV